MASIESNYAINVAVIMGEGYVREARGRYTHYLRIELGSKPRANALQMLADTRMRYPSPNFKVEMTYWHCQGESVDYE